jgi:hypothetical protein
MAYNQHATLRKILEFINEEIYGSQLNGSENHPARCYLWTVFCKFIIWLLYVKLHVRRATRRFHWSIRLENNFGLVSSCFVFRTICFEFDCHFVSSCMNDGVSIFRIGGFNTDYHNVCRLFCLLSAVRYAAPTPHPLSLLKPSNNRIELRYYRFQTVGEIRILFSALVNSEVI